jgi:ribonuclease HI
MVVLIADASFCPLTKVGGYAFWIKSKSTDYFRVRRFNEVLNNSLEAELYAITNSFKHCLQRNLIKIGDEIKIRTDCEQVIRYLTSSRYLESFSQVNEAIRLFNRLVFENKLKVQFQHIKGHTGSELYESEMQRKCDRASRNTMRNLRKSIISSAQPNDSQS